jgi:hypothetical protein
MMAEKARLRNENFHPRPVRSLQPCDDDNGIVKIDAAGKFFRLTLSPTAHHINSYEPRLDSPFLPTNARLCWPADHPAGNIRSNPVVLAAGHLPP